MSGQEFARVLLPKSVVSQVVTRGGKKPSSSACLVLFQKHVQIDETYAEMVAKIIEAATQRETFRAPLCRPSKWWMSAQAWSALQRKRLS